MVDIKKMFIPMGVLGKKAATVPAYLAGGVLASDCVAAYQPRGAPSLASSYVNQNNPATHTLTAGVAPDLVETGWSFDGSTQYLITDITPPSDQTFSAIVKYSGATITGSIHSMTGWIQSGKGFSIRCWNPTAPAGIDFINGGQTIVASGIDAGILGISGGKGWSNGINVASISASNGTKGVLYIGGENNYGFAQKFAGIIEAVYYYNVVLTDAQMIAITAAMNNLP